MKYAYEDLSHTQFEALIVLLCQELLGIGVQGFSEGPDGGRDAKFVGTAELFPSKAAPWVGTTIIQAKHTNGLNRRFSEADFFGKTSKNTVIGKEIPRIRKLREKKRLDHYMLFANRRLAASAESEICSFMAEACHMPESSIALCGLERLELWLKKFPDVAAEAELDPIDSPLKVSPDELAEVVRALAQQIDGLPRIPDVPPVPRLPYDKKNEINRMTPTYGKAQRRKYLKETTAIQAFLAAPENLSLMRLYEVAIDEFQLKIIARRKDYQSFDNVLEYLAEFLFGRDPILKRNRRLTRAVLFYMYWNCDIGEGDDAEAD